MEADGQPLALPRRDPPQLPAQRVPVRAVERGPLGHRLQGVDVVEEIAVDRARDGPRGVLQAGPLGGALIAHDGRGQPHREQGHRQQDRRHQHDEIAAQREADPAQRAAHAGGLDVTVSPPASAFTSRYPRKWG